LIGYAFAFTPMGLVATWAIVNLWSLGKTTDEILWNYYRSILAVENMVDALGRQDSGILLTLMGDIEKGISQYRENDALFLEWLGRSRDSIAVTGELEVIHDIERKYKKYFNKINEIYDFEKKGSAAPLTLATYK
jgi:two-component system, NtrC family, sensor histidine kinase KinB